MRYCVWCADKASGVTGDFVYDPERHAKGEGFWAISPVFTDCLPLFVWAKENGVSLKHY